VKVKDSGSNILFEKTFNPSYYIGDSSYINLMDYTGDLSFEITATAPAGYILLPTMIIPSRHIYTKRLPSVRPNLKWFRKGFCYFDETLGKPIWKSETGWVDATGATV
jgi:hypothetical protein